MTISLKRQKRNRVTEDTVASLLYDVQWKMQQFFGIKIWDNDTHITAPTCPTRLCVCVWGGGGSATHSLFCGDLQTVAELKKNLGGGGALMCARSLICVTMLQYINVYLNERNNILQYSMAVILFV